MLAEPRASAHRPWTCHTAASWLHLRMAYRLTPGWLLQPGGHSLRKCAGTACVRQQRPGRAEGHEGPAPAASPCQERQGHAPNEDRPHAHLRCLGLHLTVRCPAVGVESQAAPQQTWTLAPGGSSPGSEAVGTPSHQLPPMLRRFVLSQCHGHPQLQERGVGLSPLCCPVSVPPWAGPAVRVRVGSLMPLW